MHRPWQIPDWQTVCGHFAPTLFVLLPGFLAAWFLSRFGPLSIKGRASAAAALSCLLLLAPVFLAGIPSFGNHVEDMEMALPFAIASAFGLTFAIASIRSPDPEWHDYLRLEADYMEDMADGHPPKPMGCALGICLLVHSLTLVAIIISS